jgi:hypothetical protein
MTHDELLEQFLSEHGFAWEELPRDRHLKVVQAWQSIYGRVWTKGQRQREGVRAEAEYRCEHADIFVVVPLNGSGGPATLGRESGLACAYECRGSGALPDLSEFADCEFFISPPDLSWTMVHNHEDHAWGGAYFVRKEWLSPSGKRRRH